MGFEYYYALASKTDAKNAQNSYLFLLLFIRESGAVSINQATGNAEFENGLRIGHWNKAKTNFELNTSPPMSLPGAEYFSL